MKQNGVDFPEALEYVASHSGIVIKYEEISPRAGTNSAARPGGDGETISRKRIIDANNEAAKFFAQSLNTPEAQTARKMLSERNFSTENAAHFMVGYAPKGYDNLVRHLQQKGFSQNELQAAGLVSVTGRGINDRFQGRLIWPICDTAGDVLGFGARKLFDDDFFDAKYLNTSATRVYNKSKVLYGINFARKPIGEQRQCVIVEGYTDVMAMHLAGVETAVASCGTAFGVEHIQIVRRLMGDTNQHAALNNEIARQAGKIIFTFDGDKAGLNAAMKAFREDDGFVAQTYVAIVPDGMDPCDMRVHKGDLALKNLVDNAVPMIEFAIRTTLSTFDIYSREGRISAVHAVAPIVARIRDLALQSEYETMVAKETGVDIALVKRDVQQAFRSARQIASLDTLQQQNAAPPTNAQQISPELRATSQILALALQYPEHMPADDFALLDEGYFSNPFLAKIFERIVNLGGVDALLAMPSSNRLDELGEDLTDTERDSLIRLGIVELPINSAQSARKYAHELITKLQKFALERKLQHNKTKMIGMPTTSEDYSELFRQNIEINVKLKKI
jgi:DNA primase